MGTSSADAPCQESPWPVERGEGGGVNTSRSSGPNGGRSASGPVGSAGYARYSAEVCKGGPLKAAPREGAVNQRWYRELSPSVQWGQGVFSMADQPRAAERWGVLLVFLALCSIGGLCVKAIPWNGMSINGARNIVSVVGYNVLRGRAEAPRRRGAAAIKE